MPSIKRLLLYHMFAGFRIPLSPTYTLHSQNIYEIKVAAVLFNVETLEVPLIL